mmetsp:Transcript_50297/g.145009  ORF Transcript_50297/g.145009 Transcript_50297/m.145009 type:complete len:592 (-) Transcript_50297:22-1797(-)
MCDVQMFQSDSAGSEVLFKAELAGLSKSAAWFGSPASTATPSTVGGSMSAETPMGGTPLWAETPMSCAPACQEQLDLDARLAELPVDASEGHAEVLALSAEQQLLMKSVVNEDWIKLVRQLQGPRFRTSTSLPPAMGRGMRFFGKEPGSTLGLIWDRRQIDLSEAFIWPSGYFAKSHFNLDKDGKTLLNGRDEALVSLEDVLQTNRELAFWHMGRNCMVSDEPLPYNEVLTYVQGSTGIVGLFVRIASITHLLWAMGVRAFLLRTLPAAGELPIFMHDPEQGLRPFGRAAQKMVVNRFLSSVGRPAGCHGLPCLPVDVRGVGLSPQEQLDLHGGWGLTEQALADLVEQLVLIGEEHDMDDHNGDADESRQQDSIANPVRRAPRFSRVCAQKARGILAIGLNAAVQADNSAAALSLVQRMAPMLFGPDGCQQSDQDEARIVFSTVESSMTMAPPLKQEPDLVMVLHSLASQSKSPNMLAIVGATVALDDFASGRMLPRIMHACKQLESWLNDSKSVMFRLQSWHELKEHKHPPGVEAPTFSSFLTHKAIANRTSFYNDLLELERYEEEHDLLHGMDKLHTLVGAMHHPCLRL